MHQAQTKAFLHDGKPDMYYKYGLHPPSCQLTGAEPTLDGATVLTLIMLVRRFFAQATLLDVLKEELTHWVRPNFPSSDRARILFAAHGHFNVRVPEMSKNQRIISDVCIVHRDRMNSSKISKRRMERLMTATPHLKRTSFCRPRRSGRIPRN
jgi:hypothetical protein